VTDLVRINSDDGVGLPVTLADGSRWIIPAFVQITSAGDLVGSAGVGGAGTDLDTQGNIVPTYKAHTYTYDTSGNQITDSVTDGSSTWVRSYVYANGQMTTDSGWVKQ